MDRVDISGDGRLAALERQREYFESLLETSPAAIMTVDLDGTVTSWNPAAERLLGYSRDEALGRNIDDLVANRSELRAEADEISRQAARGGQVHFVTRRTRKDGSLVDVDVVAAPIYVGGEQVGLYAIYNDISELQRQKQYYASLLELSPTAVLAIDLEATITLWNAAAERLFGYSREEAIGRNVDDLFAMEDHLSAEAIDLTRRGLAGEEVQLVTQRPRRDGSLIDVEVRAAPIVVRDEQVGYYVIYHDISELQRQKRYFEALLELSPTAIAAVDLNDVVTAWNAAAERLFGYLPDEAIGRNIDDLVANDPRVHEEAVGISRRSSEGVRSRLVTQRTRKDGSLVDVEVHAAPIVVSGERVGHYAIYHDISELQRQRRYYQALVDSSPIAVALMDAEATVTAWNPAAERLFGYSASDAIGRNIDVLVASDDSIRAEALRDTELGMSGERVRALTKRTRQDGTLVDVEIFGAPVIVGDEPVGLYGLYHDVGELQRARREAEAAAEAKSAFLATMSHEIRTPMNAVIGMTDLLLRTELDAEQRTFADVIRTSGEALLSVINDILDFSKIEAGRLDLDHHPFDLRQCVESALELVARAAAEKGIDLAYVLRPATPEALVGDAGRLRQILLNLLNNAVKFTEHGEVVVSVESQPTAGHEEAAEGKPDGRHRLHFAVSDTGIGIPADRIDSLFQSFSQVDASTTRRYGGTGLGLAISRRLSELMGGTMWVESAPGEGSTFHFSIEAEAAPSPARDYEGEIAPLSGRRVLILDDNATNRDILRSYTAAWGMVSRDTGVPATALEWVRRGDPFDVAILDMQMPEMDGVTVARQIRTARDAESLPLILLTSLGRRDEGDDALFAARLAKPIRPSQLYNSLLGVFGDRAVAAASEGPTARRGRDGGTVPPLRILVVEDNQVNRQLALLLLDEIGYRAADVAVNGLEALDALERERFDVVLMDVQMPEMDGLDATRKIYERFGADRPHIIAATANATQDERERCLAAGMDDYLSKPIRIEELAAALRRARPRSAAPTPSPEPVPDVAPQTLDASVLERLRATVGSAGAVALLDTFLAEAPKLVATLERAAERGDAADLRRAAHTLKSNAATFGATALAGMARELETMGEQGALDGARERVAILTRELGHVRTALEGERERLRE